MGVEKVWDKNEVAAIVRLVRAVGEARAPGRRRSFLQGLQDLTGAAAAALWFTLELAVASASAAAPPTTAAIVGMDGEAGELFASEVAGGESPDPALGRLLRRLRNRATGTTLTHTRSQLLDDVRWYASEHVAWVRKPAALDDTIYSAHVLGPGRAAVVGVYRPWGHPEPFGEGERQLVDLLHHESSWLYRDQAPRGEIDSLPLSPRARQTLRRLLDGRGEKQIAAEMRLSVNTVHHYVKAIYRHFDVSSRAELLARWMERQG